MKENPFNQKYASKLLTSSAVSKRQKPCYKPADICNGLISNSEVSTGVNVDAGVSPCV